MTQSRRTLVSLEDTPYYHVYNRCVRRSFLCGYDKLSGKDFSYRKPKILEKLHFAASIFCIDICAFALMDNHYHLVVHVNQAEAEALSDDEVIERWTRKFEGPDVIQRYLKGDTPNEFA